MESVTVRVTKATREALREISQQRGETMQETLARAVEELRRKTFFEEVNRAYERLRGDPAAWQDELEERKAWEATLSDGLEDD